MADEPLIIRNLPSYERVSFVPTRPPLTILFHGVLRQERGLEELITSMAEWRFDGRVVIRGYGQPGYIAGLQRLARARGVDDRVVFAPRVPPERLVVEAAEAHIGYLVLPSITEQYEFVLPNKLFEYLMGGLAVLATPMPDMMAVLEWSGAGLKTRFDASAIAATLNDLKPDELDIKRKAALNAARSLNWEYEKSRLTKAVAGLTALATYSRASFQ
jgi:glycosyltransferase involved in cell wall biosynthesis